MSQHLFDEGERGEGVGLAGMKSLRYGFGHKFLTAKCMEMHT